MIIWCNLVNHEVYIRHKNMLKYSPTNCNIEKFFFCCPHHTGKCSIRRTYKEPFDRRRVSIMSLCYVCKCDYHLKCSASLCQAPLILPSIVLTEVMVAMWVQKICSCNSCPDDIYLKLTFSPTILNSWWIFACYWYTSSKIFEIITIHISVN